MMIIGIIAMVISIKGFCERKQLAKYYLVTKGEVTNVLVREGKTNATYAAEYTYKVDGKTYVIDDELFTFEMPVIGSETKISYNPQAPQEAFSKESDANYLFVMILGFMFLDIPSLMFISEFKLPEKVKRILPGFMLGAMYSFLGFGFYFGTKLNHGWVGIVLFLMGCFGIYCFLSSNYMLIFWNKLKQYRE